MSTISATSSATISMQSMLNQTQLTQARQAASQAQATADQLRNKADRAQQEAQQWQQEAQYLASQLQQNHSNPVSSTPVTTASSTPITRPSASPITAPTYNLPLNAAHTTASPALATGQLVNVTA